MLVKLIVKSLIAFIGYGAIVAFVDMSLVARILLVILIPICMVIGVIVGMKKAINNNIQEGK